MAALPPAGWPLSLIFDSCNLARNRRGVAAGVGWQSEVAK
jgi:hypothetical protein